MLVLLDLDDVIWDLVGTWVYWANKLFGTNVKYDEVVDWDIKSFFPDVSRDDFFQILEQELFWLDVKPFPEIEVLFSYLKARDIDFHIATHTHYKTVRPKMTRFLECFPNLSYNDVTLTSRKHLLKAHALVDDNVSNLEQFDGKKYLMDRPWNRKVDDKEKGLVRVYNPFGLYRELLKLKEELEADAGYRCAQMDKKLELQTLKSPIVFRDNATTVLKCPNLSCNFEVNGNVWSKDYCPVCGQSILKY